MMEPLSIRVMGEWQQQIPEDLYIPPAAFEILLEHFEGPLDFLIYLIQKNGFDLLQLDIAPIAQQYLTYIEHMKSLNIELTADYLVMAALLADLKSRLLLPQPKSLAIEDNPKQQLVDRLENYLRIKQAAERLNQFNIFERDQFAAHVALNQAATAPTGYAAQQLHDAMLCIFMRPEPVVHHIAAEPVLLEDRIAAIEAQLADGELFGFNQLIEPSQGRLGMAVTFMAILELTRQQKVQIVHDGLEQTLTIQGVA